MPNKLPLSLLPVFFCCLYKADAQTEVIYDTTNVNVFKGRESASFKLDYYHTEGYSTRDRFWYEIMIIDSTMTLIFSSPDNVDWNYITYQKHAQLHDSTLHKIKTLLKASGIKQKRKGIPQVLGSGYGADKLFIETKDLSLAGGTAYMNIGPDSTKHAFLERVKLEKERTTTISGDYEKLFSMLKSLFTALPVLLEEKDK